MTTNSPTRQYLKNYVAPAFEIKNVNLHFNLHETATIVTSKIQFKKRAADSDLILNGENLKLVSIQLNEKTLTATDYKTTDEHLTIFNVPTEFQLQIQVEINPTENKSCEGLYLSSGIFCTQCEAESFRKMTYFLDRPDVMTKYTVEIEADQKKYPQLLSNGDLIEQKTLANGKHYAKWNDPFKKPSYLFALVAGDMGVVSDTFITKSGKKVELSVYAPHGKQERCHHAMISLKKSMKWDEDRFGLEYDLGQYMIVSIDDFNMGAMENKGLNVFNSRLVLADQKTATDHDFDMIESVVGHEYFHNWTGNRVTCRNWFELSLKEGLTVFRDQEFSADMNSRSVQRIKDVDSLRSRQFTEDAGPNSHPVRPESCLAVDNFYTATIYEKGAEVIRMMQTIVGRDGFRRGMDEYFKRHDGQAVTIDDFAAAISEPNGVDFSQFKLWYSQAGTPIVDVLEKFENNKFTLTLTQNFSELENQKNNQPFYIPLKMGLLDSKGSEMHSELLILKEKTQTWTFSVNEKPVLSLNRDFSAPIKLKANVTHADLLHLIKYDTDEFNRREACQKMLLDQVQKLILDFSANKKLIANPDIIEALGFVLNDSKIDPQFKSLILSLPDDKILAQEENVLNPKAFYAAKKTIIEAFVKQFESDMIQIYKAHHSKNSVGDRSLKNLLLQYLTFQNSTDTSKVTNSTQGLILCEEQYKNANNMTDSIYALIALCNSNSSYKNTALNDFYQKWHNDSVVFNKWLVAQATAQVSDTFETVQKCCTALGFDPNNPNNLYSLHGAFAGNYLMFHTDEKPTYQWYCSEILRIDAVNPQVGARLAAAFNFTKKLPENLKSLAQTEISKLLKNEKLSKNVRELLEKCI
jgi:aminopeptidase N